jgi:fructose-bisphosphate aldolase class 1
VARHLLDRGGGAERVLRLDERPRARRYAALCQEAGLVPIVEPEVLQDGTHTLEQSRKATGRVLQALYTELHDQRIDYRGTLLKPNMVLSGYEASDRAGVDEVAYATLACLYKPRSGRGAGDRLPLRRPDRRGRDRRT